MRSLCSPTDAIARAEPRSRIGRARMLAGEWLIAIAAVVAGLVLIVPAAVLFVLACVRMGRTDPADLHVAAAKPGPKGAPAGAPEAGSRGAPAATRQDTLAAPHASIWN
ncbi:MAG: hypothetical protein ACAI43_08155 [Phycisphaerae bacterium]